MRVSALAVLSVVVGLCQADTFKVPVPWYISDMESTIEPELLRPNKTTWKFHIADNGPNYPQLFDTDCFCESLWEADSDDYLCYGPCSDKNVTFHLRKGALPEWILLDVTHEYSGLCASVDENGGCVDQGLIEFPERDVLAMANPLGGLVGPFVVKQTKPLIIYPIRAIPNEADTYI